MDAEFESELDKELERVVKATAEVSPINNHPPIQSLTEKYQAVEEYQRHLKETVAMERMNLEQDFRKRLLQIGQDHETKVRQLVADAEAERLQKLRDLKAVFDEKKRELDLLAQRMG